MGDIVACYSRLRESRGATNAGNGRAAQRRDAMARIGNYQKVYFLIVS
jgi:hypothetical protein